MNNVYSNKIKKISNILFVLSILSIFFAMIIILIVSLSAPVFGMAEVINNSYIFFLFIPITIMSLIVGIIFYKNNVTFYKKNIKVGIIFSILLLSIGVLGIASRDLFSNDYSYIKDIENIIEFKLPNEGYISRIKDKEHINTNNDNIEIFSFSTATFFNQEEVNVLIENIKSSDIWADNNTVYANILDISYDKTSKNYDYFLLYNVTTQVYNQNILEKGSYELIYIAYSVKLNYMYICEYTIQLE